MAYSRSYGDHTILVVNNLSRFAQPAELDLRAYEGAVPVEMIGNHSFPRIGSLPYFVTLSPHSFFWFRLDRDGANRGTTA